MGATWVRVAGMVGVAAVSSMLAGVAGLVGAAVVAAVVAGVAGLAVMQVTWVMSICAAVALFVCVAVGVLVP